MKTIYLVRHGESEANARGLLAGSNLDTPLTQKGEEQARQTGQSLKGRQVDLVVSSPLSRTYVTANIIAEVIGFTHHIVTNDLLLERDFGDASGQPRQKGYDMLDNGTAIGAETLQQLHGRVIATFKWLEQLPADHMVVVTHAGYAQMIKVVANGGSWEHFMQHSPLGNAEVFEFTLE
jgi:broad specificity phosphatase PhoE